MKSITHYPLYWTTYQREALYKVESFKDFFLNITKKEYYTDLSTIHIVTKPQAEKKNFLISKPY
jgi:hypothetical protein